MKDMEQKTSIETKLNSENSLEFWLNNSKCNLDEEIVIKDKHLQEYMPAIEEEVTGKWLREWMALIGLDEREFYLDGVKVTPELLEKYKSYRNIPSDDYKVKLRYGVVVNGAPLTDLPTEDIFTDSECDIRYNMLQETFVKVNSPVIILLEDTTGKYYYVRSFEFTGWTKKDNIAIIEDKKKWEMYFSNNNFVMIAEDFDITICDFSGTFSYSSKTYMGTKLYLAPGGDNDTYKVYVPARNEEGIFVNEITGIVNKEFAILDYLPATRRNILKLAFNVWGDEYGWGGRNGLRDCSSYIRDIFLCFGYVLPRNSSFQMRIEDGVNIEKIQGYSNKNEAISILEPGDILDIGGHVMIYLGEYEHKKYIISMLSNYVPEEVTENYNENAVKIAHLYINSLDVHRKNGNTWMEELKSYIHWTN